ncbi:MAG: hypothetical protein AAGH60_02935 [Pseudomonadota bacterium]
MFGLGQFIENSPQLAYTGAALGAAGAFYGATRFAGTHASAEFKSTLTAWLEGRYEATWTSQFIRLFDIVFGERHLSWKRFFRSALASLISVAFLYLVLGYFLGLIGTRTFGDLPVWQVLLIGAAINIIPDYLSLIETRWLLQRFVHVRNPFAQLLLLVADFIFTALIIFAAIYVFLFLTGQRIPSPVEIVALFSVYAVFFYSTFLTSVWSWLYCLSSWFMRLFTKLGLNRILGIRRDPVAQIAAVGTILIAVGGFLAGPAMTRAENGAASAFNDWVCRLDAVACFHAARVSDDLEETVRYLDIACGEDDRVLGTCGERLDDYFASDWSAINEIWEQGCTAGAMRACSNWAYAFNYGLGVELNHERAVELYGMACDGGSMLGCTSLGWMHMQGLAGLPVDEARAVALYTHACDGGYMVSCANLGFMHERGRGGLPIDQERAVELYTKACDGGVMRGCAGLGLMHRQGLGGLPIDEEQAMALYSRACDGGDTVGCANLGWMHEQGRGGLPVDEAQAVELYTRACEGGEDSACQRLDVIADVVPNDAENQ